jgi:opacity protein-like surface antigen
MNKAILGMALVLMAACAVHAQEVSSAAPAVRGSENAAAAFSDTSAAQVNLFPNSSNSSAAPSFALSTPAAPSANPLPAAPTPAPAPAPKPTFVFGDRDDYRWQLGLGVEFFRFQSNIITASLVGVNTTINYFTNTWFAVEGNLVTGFAPTIYENEHVKYFEGGGGIRIGGRRARFEPFAHALVGGAHLQPQTAGNSRNALSAQAGIGVDYRVNSRLSLRLAGDYVYTDFFKQTQNNYQGTAGVVFHF